MESLVNIGLVITAILLGVAALAAIVLPLIYFVKNFNIGKAKNSFISLAILIVIFVITVLLSSSEITEVAEQFNVSSGLFRLIGGAIITTYVLTFIAVGVSIYSTVNNKIK